MSSQRVLLVHRFFAPDVTTYAQMLEILAQHLSAAGHQVTVLTSPPSYNSAYSGPKLARRERTRGYDVIRLRVPGANSKLGKLVGGVVFPLAVVVHMVTRRRAYDIVSVTTIPPVVMGLAGRLGCTRSRRTRLVYHCMDLYPEAAETLGLVKSGLVTKVALWLDGRTVAMASRVIVLSEDMAATLRARNADANTKEKISVCNNFILADASQAVNVPELVPAKRTRLIFAGNLGRFQGLDSLVQAIRLVAAQRQDFEVVFLGAGALAGWLTEQGRTGLPIEVWPFLPLPEAMRIIESSDIAVLSLAPEVIRAAYPSKLLMYLEVGVPLLAIVESDSELGRLVVEDGLGFVAGPGDPDRIASQMSAAIDGHKRYDSGAIQATGRRLFGRDRVLAQWTRMYGLEES